jgi:hypothetical protein
MHFMEAKLWVRNFGVSASDLEYLKDVQIGDAVVAGGIEKYFDLCSS